MNPNFLLLVTGATGQIGHAVVRTARAEGWRVRVIVRNHSRPDPLFSGPNIDVLIGDLRDPTVFARVLPGVTHICHCAARVGDWGDEQEYRETNIAALQRFLDAALDLPSAATLQAFVHISSLGVYEPRDHFGTDESVPPFKSGLDAYNRTKAESEELLLAHPLTKRVRTLILRPGFVYGPGDRHVLPHLIKALEKKIFAYFGDGSARLDQVAVANVAHAVMLALVAKDTTDRVFNITDGSDVTRKVFVETIADLARLPRPRTMIPKKLGWILASMCDRVGRALKLKNPPALSKARYKFLALNLQFSIERAKQQLGYRPIQSFHQGMAEAVTWYQTHSNRAALPQHRGQ